MCYEITAGNVSNKLLRYEFNIASALASNKIDEGCRRWYRVGNIASRTKSEEKRTEQVINEHFNRVFAFKTLLFGQLFGFNIYDKKYKITTFEIFITV